MPQQRKVQSMKMTILLVLGFYSVCKAESNINTATKSSSLSVQPFGLRNLCPYNKFCHSEPLMEIKVKNFEPCCEECSCESDCFETGSCCPDMPLAVDHEPKYPCRHLSYYGNIIVNNKDEYIDKWYHVIDDCPTLVHAISYKRCYNPTQVQDYVLVTETKTGKIYRNMHCAECNGILNFEKLDLRIDCKDIVLMTSLITSEERDKYVMENCSLMPYISRKIKTPSHCLPQSHVIKTCNITGFWNVYDIEIEKACLGNYVMRNTIFKSFTRDRFEHFANIYCYLCNVHSHSNRSDSCKILDENNPSKSGRISFFGVLDTNVWTEEIVEKDRKRCHNTQIWDPYVGICRQLLCPFGHVPSYGSCKGLFSNIEGYSLSISFNVNIQYELSLDPNDSTTFSFIASRLPVMIGIDRDCGVCRISVFEDTNSEFIFRYEIFATAGCTYDAMLKKIRKIAVMEKITLQFRYRNHAVTAKLSLKYEDIYVTPGFNRLFETVYAFCNVLSHVNESIFLYCPAVMLSSAEVNKLKLNNVLSYLHFQNSTFTDHRACVDDYFALQHVMSATHEISRKASFIFTMALLALFFT